MKVYVHGNAMMKYLARRDPPMLTGRGDDVDRDILVRWLARYAERRDCDVTLVFDRIPPSQVLPRIQHHGRITIVNVAPGKGARDEIAGPANRDAQNEPTYVVTDDFKLSGSLRKGAAEVWRPHEFFEKASALMAGEEDRTLDEPDGKYSGLSDREVDYWARFFEEEG